MSYAGVESEDEYRDRQRRELDRIVPHNEDKRFYRLWRARQKRAEHLRKAAEWGEVIAQLETADDVARSEAAKKDDYRCPCGVPDCRGDR